MKYKYRVVKNKKDVYKIQFMLDEPGRQWHFWSMCDEFSSKEEALKQIEFLKQKDLEQEWVVVE